MSNQKGFSKIVAVIIIVFLLIVATIYVFLNKQKPSSINHSMGQRLNENILKNGQYVYADGSGRRLTLIDGVVQTVKYGDEGHSGETLGDIAIGDLNNDGQDDAVITMVKSYDFLDEGGSSGGEINLNAVILNQNKSPEMILSTDEWLGLLKFITINSLTIKSGIISVEISDDSQAPSVRTIKKYKLDGNKLAPVL